MTVFACILLLNANIRTLIVSVVLVSCACCCFDLLTSKRGRRCYIGNCVYLLISFVSLEVEMISRAHNMGFLTTPYAFNPEEATAMAKAGAHIIVAHMGLTTAGSIGAKTAVTLDDSVIRVQAIADAALGINPDVIILCHGGKLSVFLKASTNRWYLNDVTSFFQHSKYPTYP